MVVLVVLGGVVVVGGVAIGWWIWLVTPTRMLQLVIRWLNCMHAHLMEDWRRLVRWEWRGVLLVLYSQPGGAAWGYHSRIVDCTRPHWQYI